MGRGNFATNKKEVDLSTSWSIDIERLLSEDGGAAAAKCVRPSRGRARYRRPPFLSPRPCPLRPAPRARARSRACACTRGVALSVCRGSAEAGGGGGDGPRALHFVAWSAPRALSRLHPPSLRAQCVLQNRALPRLATTAVPRATLSRALATKVEPDPWVLEEYEDTDITPPELFGYCASRRKRHYLRLSYSGIGCARRRPCAAVLCARCWQ